MKCWGVEVVHFFQASHIVMQCDKPFFSTSVFCHIVLFCSHEKMCSLTILFVMFDSFSESFCLDGSCKCLK